MNGNRFFFIHDMRHSIIIALVVFVVAFIVNSQQGSNFSYYACIFFSPPILCAYIYKSLFCFGFESIWAKSETNTTLAREKKTRRCVTLTVRTDQLNTIHTYNKWNEYITWASYTIHAYTHHIYTLRRMQAESKAEITHKRQLNKSTFTLTIWIQRRGPSHRHTFIVLAFVQGAGEYWLKTCFENCVCRKLARRVKNDTFFRISFWMLVSKKKSSPNWHDAFVFGLFSKIIYFSLCMQKRRKHSFFSLVRK